MNTYEMLCYEREGGDVNKRNIIKAGINIKPCWFHIFPDYKNVYNFLLCFLLTVAGTFLWN